MKPAMRLEFEVVWGVNMGGIRVFIARVHNPLSGTDEFFMNAPAIGIKELRPLHVGTFEHAVGRTRAIMQVHFEETAEKIADGHWGVDTPMDADLLKELGR